MKTLAVLSALATIAFAAPALEETSLTPSDLTITQQRQKKSTLEEIVTEKSLDHSEDHASPEISNKFARTFSGFKKPIIVKKKIGYSVYRNSDEEQAQTESRESCNNQIRVKLCNDNNSFDKMDHHANEEMMSENEMKYSIDLAKEAVETFQRDLQKMGHDSVERIGHRHAPLDTDEELRDDIERARQALEHIQRKFKNLDTISSSSNGRTSDVHLNTMKSDEERLAQWKDTLSNHKHVETGRNLEENFNDINKMATPEDMKSSATETHLKSISVKEVDGQDWSKFKEAKSEDHIKTMVEEKSPKMEIHSDSLKKENFMIEKDHNKEKIEKQERNVEEKIDSLEKTHDKQKKSESKNNAECTDHEHKNIRHVQENLEQHADDNQKSIQLDDSDIKMQEKDSELKSSVDSSEPTKINHNTENQRSMKEEDHKTHENLDTLTMRSKISEGLIERNHNNEDLKQTFEESKKSLSPETMRKEVDEDKQDLHHTQRLTQMHSLPKPEEQTMDKIHSTFKNDMEPHGSSATVTKLEETKSNFKNHMDEHDGGDVTNEHKITAPSRAASDFHKEILNNMDFTEDSHQSSLSKQSPSKTSHLLKHEKSDLHERLNVPQMQHSSDTIKNMAHLSDAVEDNTNQRTQLKMATMFNNEQPNLNVQFNNPQTFEEQTNVQNLMPFKSATDFHDEHFHNINSNQEIPSNLQDPLHTRWAHENHLEKMKAASHIHPDNMEMDGSSPHISIDRSMPLRSNLMDGHMNFNEQLNDHQRWAQGKNVNAYKSVPMGTDMSMQNFHGNERKTTDHFEDHETLLSRNNDHVMMMHGKSNMDSAIQSSNFMRMRGPPKMALEYAGPSQWNHNHGAFRSSYGPASYGAGGGAQTSGGSAVGVFPNANVGNYAVPLLLSCSPSVVSGSLAKTNSYNAPSYRSGDINFVKKRDTDKIEGNTGLKGHGHVLGHKPNPMLVTKL